jgi:iron(III) transport system substrate-binding protein
MTSTTRTKPPRLPIWLVAALLLASSGCRIERGTPSTSTTSTTAASTTAAPAGRVVLYTSAYREVTDALTSLARRTLPDVELVVFQGGSEKVASRLDADLAAGRAGADILLVSDPLLYRRLHHDGQLLPYASPNATPIDRRLVDFDNAFVAARVSTMVIAHHTDTSAASVPTSLAKLLKGELSESAEVAFGDPLSSGTAFMTVVVVGNGDGTFLSALRGRGASIAGGNAAVLQRVLSKERRFGVVLLENVLAAAARGEPIAFVLPDDAVTIPGELAILKDTRNPVAARAVIDLILSPAGQALIRGSDGNMHAVDPRLAPPASTVPPLAALLDRGHADDALLLRVAGDRASLQRSLEQALLQAP